MAGRKGIPNRVTAYTRETFRQTWEDIAPHVANWIKRVSTRDPGKAAALALQLAEYHIPKLQRTEVVGVADQPVQVVISINQDDDDPGTDPNSGEDDGVAAAGEPLRGANEGDDDG